MRFKTLIILISLLTLASKAQVALSPYDIPQYGFINYDINQLELVNTIPAFERLFSQFDTLIRNGSNRINIVHIGGSHIQADVYTHRVRQELQTFYPGLLGSRGFFFPFPIARTNCPSNLHISYTGEWLTGKNTQPDPPFILGLSGITASMVSDTGEIRIVALFDTLNHYDFNRVKIFCNAPENGIIPNINNNLNISKYIVDTAGRCIEYFLKDYTDTLLISIFQSGIITEKFELYGISLENDDPGVVYNSIGVNGATLRSYLRCSLFVNQLKMLNPDLVIISIGTNEGNSRDFDNEAYKMDYLSLLDSVNRAAPGAAVLLTVPNDSYLLKRYINRNTAKMRETIFNIANTYHYGVWDFYSVMGGLNSVKLWYDFGLMNNDHIHFNKQGYLLKGELFYAALMKSWEEHLISLPNTPVVPLRLAQSIPGNETNDSIEPTIIKHLTTLPQYHDRLPQTDIPLQR